MIVNRQYDLAAGKDLLDRLADVADPVCATADGLSGSTVPFRLRAKTLRPGVSLGGDRLLFADALDL